VTDFETAYLKGKTVEQLIDDMAEPAAMPGSVVHEAMRAAIATKLAERVAAPRRWAMVASLAAVVSAAAAVVSAIAAF
jgi:nitrogen regulatory protein PII-like uncharacterized protein